VLLDHLGPFLIDIGCNKDRGSRVLFDEAECLAGGLDLSPWDVLDSRTFDENLGDRRDLL